MGLPADLDQIVKKYNFDLNKYPKQRIEIIRKVGGGSLIALPDSNDKEFTTLGIVYNKDIFDHFGIPYPDSTKAMTWDELIDLAHRMTRNDDRQYYGFFAPGLFNNMYGALGLSFLNDKREIDLTSDLWQKLFDVNKRIYTSQNNMAQNRDAVKGITQENFAMYGGPIHPFTNDEERLSKIIKFDFAPYPYLKGYNTVAPATGVFSVTSTSKHKEAVFEVLDYLSTLEDNGAKQIREVGKKGYHIDALRNRELGVSVPDEFTQTGKKLLNQTVTQMQSKDLDINTALRTFEENARKAWAEMKK
jgi:multiple sugar transport system substrate-binding protein